MPHPRAPEGPAREHRRSHRRSTDRVRQVPSGPGPRPPFGVGPETGTVYYVLPDGEAWFANSSIDLWLQTLHHYGRRVSQSPLLNDLDEYEDEALAELSELTDELKAIDPPAFEGYIGFIWAEFLDRWLW
ncbi:SUKH-4 family immunity protein [Streptomyces canus]|uniref:SUKH-4 family immunity protein n=1 Tax=Streptomyces canus TaxID=58343 RepID=UPI003F6B4A4C